ncbi:flippase [Halorubrum distributum]|uniref:flippase n=1 Tax=Halorubrum distributum TaxID=29283 RepID=UPI002954C1B2|nr:flippase [Halorubrum distributum]MDV7348160.1 flippase [Halorubrum distributum]
MPEDEGGTISRILSGSTIVLAGSIVNKIIAFVGSVFMARLLGDVGYGVVVVALSVYFVLSGLLTLGLSGGIARNYPQANSDEAKRGILVTAFRLGVAVGTLGGTVVFLAAEPIALRIFDDPSITLPLRILGISLPLKVILNLSNGSFQAIKKPIIKTSITSIVQPIVRIPFIIIFVLAGFEAVGVTGAYTIAIGTAAFLSLYYVWQDTTLFDLSQPAQVDYRSLLSFSLPLVGSTILIDLMNNADTILLAALGVSADAGQYNVAFVLSQATLLFYQTLGFMYVPEISELYGADQMERAGMVYRAITKWVLFISVPFILTAAAFPTYTLTFIYSSQYSTATVPFLFLIAGFVTHILNGPNHSTLTAFGDTRQIFKFDIITISFNIILNVSLIPKFGIAGAAVATATAYLIRNTAMTLYLKNSYDIHPFSRYLLVPITLVSLVAVFLKWLISEPSFLLVILYVSTLIFTITVGYLSRGIEEADLILSETIEGSTDIDLGVVKRIHKILR